MVHLRRNIGMLTSREWHGLDLRLCRTHAVEGALYYFLLSALWGWWGVISLFVNYIALAADLAALAVGLFQRRPQGEALVSGSFRQWYKDQRSAAMLARYVESKRLGMTR